MRGHAAAASARQGAGRRTRPPSGSADATARGLCVAELAARLGESFEGTGDLAITGAAPYDTAGAGQVAFLTADRLGKAPLRSGAACILVPRHAPPVPGPSIIRVDDPRRAFASVVAWLHLRPDTEAGVHATAVVHATAQLGANVTIGPFCSVAAGAVIGDDTVLHARVTVYDGVVLGRRCLVHSGAVLGADGFGFVQAEDRYQKIPQVGGVEIGDDVEIGANSTIDRGTLVATRIGAGTKIDNLVHVAHNCVIGANVVIAAQSGVAGSTRIGDWVVIGGQVGIGDRVVVDDRAVIGAASAIPTGKRIRAGEPVWGVPARPLRQHLRQLASVGRVEGLRRDLQALHERLRGDATSA